MNTEEIKHLAKLSSLELNPAEMALISEEMRAILLLVGKLQAVDTAGVDPLFHPIALIEELSQPFRIDQVTETDLRDVNMACAPAVHEGLFLVPKVIE